MNTSSSELVRLRSGLLVPEDEIFTTGTDIYSYFEKNATIWIECLGKLSLAAAVNFEPKMTAAIPLGENTRKILQNNKFHLQPFEGVTCQHDMVRTAIAASMIHAEIYDAGLDIYLQDPISDSGHILSYLSRSVK